MELLDGETLAKLIDGQAMEIDRLIDLGVQHGLVDKSGAWYSYKGDRIGQGRDNVREFIKKNPAMAQELDSALREIMLPQKGAPEEAEEAQATEEAEA